MPAELLLTDETRAKIAEAAKGIAFKRSELVAELREVQRMLRATGGPDRANVIKRAIIELHVLGIVSVENLSRKAVELAFEIQDLKRKGVILTRERDSARQVAQEWHTSRQNVAAERDALKQQIEQLQKGQNP